MIFVGLSPFATQVDPQGIVPDRSKTGSLVEGFECGIRSAEEPTAGKSVYRGNLTGLELADA